MQFMTMIHAREDQGQPTPEMYAAMDELITRYSADGTFVTGGGLMPGSHGATIQVRGGEVMVSDGPFAEATELVGGFAVIETESLAKCIELCRETIDLHLKYWPSWEGYSEIRPMAG